MTFLYILIAAVVVWYIGRFLLRSTPENKIEKLEEFANTMLSSYRTTNKVSFGQDGDDPEVSQMEDWYVRLKEKYKHDQSRLLQLAEDWKDYTYYISSKNINGYLSLDTQDEKESQKHAQEVRESHLKIEEVENRFADSLGTEFRKKLEADRKKKREDAEAFWNPKEEMKAPEEV